MPVTMEDIVGYLRSKGWEFEISSGAIKMKIQGSNGIYDMYIVHKWEKEVITAYIYYPCFIPREKRNNAVKLAAKINWGLLFSTCEVDLKTGKTRFRSSMLTDNSSFNEEQFTTLISTVSSLADSYFPAFGKIIKGLSSETALKEIEIE